MSKKFDIAHTLQHLRKESGMSVAEVVGKLEAVGIEKVKEKTLYGYESGFSMPNADIFLELCVIYGCDNPMSWWNKDKPILSNEEYRLINMFRTLDDETQSDITADISRKYDRIMDRKKENDTKSA